MLAEISRMIEVGSSHQGKLAETDFDQVVASLKSIGQIDRPPSFGEFYAGSQFGDGLKSPAGPAPSAALRNMTGSGQPAVNPSLETIG